MTRREIFVNAHEIAKENRNQFTSYRAAFSYALKSIYAGMKCEKTTEQKLEDLGIEAWEKGDMKRYYINVEHFAAVFGLEIYRYNSGNICGAHLNGEKISNNRAGKLIGAKKFYFDAVSQKWFERYCMNAPKPLCDELAAGVRV